jgi:DNA-directed RNA polymerase subunit RPC12/RpoP
MRASASKEPSRHQFPCSQCGALLVYAPGTEFLECGYCKHKEPVPSLLTKIQEHDFRSALHELVSARRTDAVRQPIQVTNCDACGASFEFSNDIHSGECPYCGHAIVLETGAEKLLKPQSLLPFKITEAQAKQHFRGWIKGLWFAPNGIKKYARDDNRLSGVYLPYWTYDSHTDTNYVGERGDAYQVPQKVVQVIDGKRVVRTMMVTKIRWTRVRGMVARFFDDVLVGASRSLPRQITDRLQPWDLNNLVPYQEQYLSGFGSQAYQVELDEGFEYARETMNSIIRGDIARDIGGDAQRIHRFDTRHSSTTFKHVLLPIWTAGFRFKGKAFHFVVNGRTGKVRGERPYSPWKIAIAIVIGIIVVLGGIYLFDYYSQYQQTNPIRMPQISPGTYR